MVYISDAAHIGLCLICRCIATTVGLMQLAKDDSPSWENTATKAAVADMAVIVHGIVLSSIMDVRVTA